MIKNVLILIFACFSVVVKASTHNDVLDQQISLLTKSSIKNIVVFGEKCFDCNKISTLESYYILYDSLGYPKCKILDISNNNKELKVVFDSTFLSVRNGLVLDYLDKNFETIQYQFINSDSISIEREIVNGDKVITVPTIFGHCYYIYILNNNKNAVAYFPKTANTNRLFKQGYEYWVLINLLINQFSGY